MVITEDWTDDSGIRYYQIGVDVQDLFVNTAAVGDTCFCSISYLLADWANVKILIYDTQDQLVRDVWGGSQSQGLWSTGVHLGWTGRVRTTSTEQRLQGAS